MFLALVVLIVPIFSTAGVLTIEIINGDNVQSKLFSTSHVPIDPSVSIREIAQFLNSRTHYTPETRIYQVYFSQHQVKIQDGNPFIIVESLLNSKESQVFQIPVNLASNAQDYFIPVKMVADILSITLDGQVDVAEDLSKITVTYREFDLSEIYVEEKSNGTLIRFPLNKDLEDFENHRDSEGNNYLTLVNIRGNVDAIESTPLNGLVKDIIAKPLPSESLQLIIKVDNAKVSGVDLEYDRYARVLYMNIRASTGSVSAVSPGITPVPNDNTVHLKEKWHLDVIVIDAGHGGKDPGAIGRYYKTKEKDVTLGIALKLGEVLKKKLKDVNIVYTRNNDTFIPLKNRGKIANEAKGKLFISIHANANRKRTISGTETYFLGLHKSEDALEVAKLENSVIFQEEDYEESYADFTDENLIILTMAQSAFLEKSELIASTVTQKISSGTGLKNKGVKQAGFMVLWTPSMPSILIETGYLSNKGDEKILRTKEGQQKVAESIADAIVKYKEEYERSLSN